MNNFTRPSQNTHEADQSGPELIIGRRVSVVVKAAEYAAAAVGAEIRNEAGQLGHVFQPNHSVGRKIVAQAARDNEDSAQRLESMTVITAPVVEATDFTHDTNEVENQSYVETITRPEADAPADKLTTLGVNAKDLATPAGDIYVDIQ